MKKILSVIIFFICYTAGNYISASTTIDYNEIENYVKNNRSGYDELVKRFAGGDSTLTNNDIARIYYGYSFTENYSPYSYNREVEDAFDGKDYSKAFKISRKLLESNPVSMRLLLISFVSLDSLRLDSDPLNTKMRFNQILAMILDSGDGSERKPFKVICISDEYETIKSAYKMEKIVGQQFTKESMCDRLAVILEGNNEPVGIYFDISLAYGKTSSKKKR